MPTLQRQSLLVLFPMLSISVLGLVACSPSSSDGPSGTGGTQSIGTSSGGSTIPVTSSSSGGSTQPTSSSGGAPVESSSGGSTTPPETPSGGSGAVVPPSGGGSGVPSGGAGAGGPVVVGPPPATKGIPDGYPMPTADNVAKCTKVGLTAGLCPGGGPGPVCMQCLFGGSTYETTESPPPSALATMEAGNYLVTVRIGGPMAGDTYIGTESSRGLLQTVTTTAGQTIDYAFVVNVRDMEGQPNHRGGPAGYPGLDIFFSGTNPQVTGIGYALATATTKPVMVYMASDSTGCDQTGNIFGGWGQMLPEFFAPPVGIANYANSGASSNFGYWNNIKAKWSPGDWVIIQFGHNDKGTPDATVQANLEKMVADAQAAQVKALLVSPPARVQFQGNMDGSQASLHAVSAQGAAKAKGVDYIDLTSLSTAWYNMLGSQAAALKFHANGSDATHTNLAGAEKLASLVAQAIKDQNVALAPYLRQ